jgi:hypothetical protein
MYGVKNEMRKFHVQLELVAMPMAIARYREGYNSPIIAQIIGLKDDVTLIFFKYLKKECTYAQVIA